MKVVRCLTHIPYFGYKQEYVQVAEYEDRGQKKRLIEVHDEFLQVVKKEELPAHMFEDVDKTVEQYRYERRIADMNRHLFDAAQIARGAHDYYEQNKGKIEPQGTEILDLVTKLRNILNSFEHGDHSNRSTEDAFFK